MIKHRNWSFFKEIDLFGKEPDIYYKGKQKKTSWMGRICTLLYIAIYIFFLAYKLIRMFKRQDVSFSETNSSIGELPKIHVTNEKFLYAFALLDDEQRPYADRSIYEPFAMAAITTTTDDGRKMTNNTYLDIDTCTIDDFGKNYQKYASSYDLSSFYCLKNININFEGYSGAVNNTNIILMVNKCNPRSSRVQCKSPEDIDKKLDGKKMLILSEDFDITPNDFEHPVKEKLNVNTMEISLAQLQTYAAFYQLTNIETDYNLFGFEALADIKKEKYLVYHSSLVMQTQMPPNSTQAVIYYIAMNEKVLTNQRKYTQFVDVLGDVGGLMEVIHSVFGVICFLVADILYDKTMVNNLFSFNLEENAIKIKKNNNKLNIHLNKKTTIKESNGNFNNIYNINNLNKSAFHFPASFKDENEKNDLDATYSKKETFKPKIITKKMLNISKNKKNYANNRNNLNNISNSERISYINKKTIKNQKTNLNPIHKAIKENNEIEINIFQKKDYDIERHNTEKSLPKKAILDKINSNILCIYFCFCCSRKRKNIGNTLLDEAMNIIKDKLDIYNMFRNLYYIDDIKHINNYEYKDIEFSDECKQKLKEISHRIYNLMYGY